MVAGGCQYDVHEGLCMFYLCSVPSETSPHFGNIRDDGHDTAVFYLLSVHGRSSDSLT